MLYEVITDAYPETIEASLRLGASALRMLQVAEDDIDAMSYNFV